MKCEKWGISVAFLSALAFLLGWYNLTHAFGNMTLVFIAMLVVVCICNNETLRKNVMTAFMYSLIFWLLEIVLAYISSAYSSFILKIYDFILSRPFHIRVDVNAVTRVYDFFKAANLSVYILKFLGFAEFVLMVIFVIMSLKGKELNIPVFSNLASRAMGIIPKKKAKEDNPITNDKETLTDIPKASSEEKKEEK